MAGVTGVEGVERERVREKGVVVRSGCDDEFSQLSVVSQLSVSQLIDQSVSQSVSCQLSVVS